MKTTDIGINGVRFLVEEIDGGYQFHKIVNNKKMAVTQEELKILMERIKELSTQKMSIEAAKDNIKAAIESNQLTKEADIKDYLLSINITENYDELENYARELLTEKKPKILPVDVIREKILTEFSKMDSKESSAFVSFTKKKSVGDDYLEIDLGTRSGEDAYSFPKMYYNYNDEAKKQLIEPVIAEIVLKSKIESSRIVNKSSLVDFVSDYYLKTTNNNYFSLKDIDREYANELEKKINELAIRYGSGLSDDEVQDVYDQQQEDNRELNKPMTLVRKKKNQTSSLENEKKAGFVNSLVLFAGLDLISILLFLFQILVLNN